MKKWQREFDMTEGIVPIRGKQYKTVAYRVNEFRGKFPDYTISTELVESNDVVVVMKASIFNIESRLLSTGYAEEVRAASQINKTSALENCETSAIGRALAALGFAGTEYASADELVNALQQQEVNNKKMYDDFMGRYEENKHDCAVWYSQLSEEEMSEIKEGSPKNKKTATQTILREMVAQMHVNFGDYAEQLSIAVQKEDVTSVGQLWNEMVDYERRCVFDRLDQNCRDSLNNLINRAIALKEQSNG